MYVPQSPNPMQIGDAWRLGCRPRPRVGSPGLELTSVPSSKGCCRRSTDGLAGEQSRAVHPLWPASWRANADVVRRGWAAFVQCGMRDAGCGMRDEGCGMKASAGPIDRLFRRPRIEAPADRSGSKRIEAADRSPGGDRSDGAACVTQPLASGGGDACVGDERRNQPLVCEREGVHRALRAGLQLHDHLGALRAYMHPAHRQAAGRP